MGRLRLALGGRGLMQAGGAAEGEDGLVLDTNILVAAGFGASTASARLLGAIRRGRWRLVWHEATRRETEAVLRRIPRLDWERFRDIFRPEWEYRGSIDPGRFARVADPDDRKFAALSAATAAILISNDSHLLECRDELGIRVMTPSEFLAREEA